MDRDPSLLDEVRLQNGLSFSDGSPDSPTTPGVSPGDALSGQIRDDILSRIESIPPSERARYVEIMESLDSSKKAAPVRVYYRVFEFTDPDDCFAFEDITRDPGFISVHQSETFVENGAVLYWAAIHVRPTLYATLRQGYLTDSRVKDAVKEDVVSDMEDDDAPEEVVEAEVERRLSERLGKRLGETTLWWKLWHPVRTWVDAVRPLFV